MIISQRGCLYECFTKNIAFFIAFISFCLPCATIQKTANTTEDKEQDEEFAAQCALYVGATHIQREYIQDERQIIVF